LLEGIARCPALNHWRGDRAARRIFLDDTLLIIWVGHRVQ
jgi:hypothetical protein